MPKSAKNSWFIAAAVALSATVFATHALADCEDDQQDIAGKAVAAAAAAKLNTLIPGAGKKMVSIDTCDAAGTAIVASFKYNVIGADGLYWVQGTAKVSGKVVNLKFTALSPNLAAASAKAGVKLASN